VIRGRSSSTEGGPILMLIRCSPRGGVDGMPCRACATKRIAGAKGKWNYPQPAQQRRKPLKIFLHRCPDTHDLRESRRAMAGLEPRADRADVDRILRGVENQPGERGESGHRMRLGQALERGRAANSNGLAERGLGI